MAGGGLAFLGLSMVGSVLLITDYLLNPTASIIITAIATAWILAFWAMIPWFRHTWIDEDDEEEDKKSSGSEI
jgi:hypothetical protein